jgi:ABC-2 type transport system ATP-binding protein
MTTIPSSPAIAATGLRKSFGDQLVLDGIDLEVPEGTVFSLLGPNGAGKTTTVHILSRQRPSRARRALVARERPTLHAARDGPAVPPADRTWNPRRPAPQDVKASPDPST